MQSILGALNGGQNLNDVKLTAPPHSGGRLLKGILAGIAVTGTEISAVPQAEEGDCHYESLLARTIFRVNDADFSIQDEKVPLLDFSFVLRTVASELPDGEEEDYESPLSWLKIAFARSGEMGLSSNFTVATATVALGERRHATAVFHARVMQDLMIRYPKLPENPAAQKFFVPDPTTGA